MIDGAPELSVGDAVGWPRGQSREPLLPGEAADSEVADDAEHWVAVYEELTGFLGEFDPPSDAVARYRRRLRYWRCRRDELGGALPAAER